MGLTPKFIPPKVMAAIRSKDKKALKAYSAAGNKAKRDIHNNSIFSMVNNHMKHPDTQHVNSWHEEDIRKNASVIAPLIGEAVESLANMMKSKAITPPDEDKNKAKIAAEGDLNSNWFDAAKLKNKSETSTPNFTIPKTEPKSYSSNKNKIFEHILKHKAPYGAGALALGVGGAAYLARRSNKKNEFTET